MQVLVDTSVWSVALRRPSIQKNTTRLSPAEQAQRRLQDAYSAALKDLIADGRAVLIGPVRQELLSGIKSAEQFEKLRSMLAAFPDIAIQADDHERAAQMFNQCQANGVQGSHVDFLICAVAVKHKLAILSLDQDFVHFKKCLPIQLYDAVPTSVSF
jgi:predicted nucleic acid-binding protein